MAAANQPERSFHSCNLGSPGSFSDSEGGPKYWQSAFNADFYIYSETILKGLLCCKHVHRMSPEDALCTSRTLVRCKEIIRSQLSAEHRYPVLLGICALICADLPWRVLDSILQSHSKMWMHGCLRFSGSTASGMIGSDCSETGSHSACTTSWRMTLLRSWRSLPTIQGGIHSQSFCGERPCPRSVLLNNADTSELDHFPNACVPQLCVIYISAWHKSVECWHTLFEGHFAAAAWTSIRGS